MNALSILFKTDRFNLSRVGEDFINPCCFGEDLAAWIRQKLIELGVETKNSYQEDWGWELPVRNEDRTYYLCMSGNSDGSAASPDEGEWRIIVEKKRSLSERIGAKGKITVNNSLFRLVKNILSNESSFRDVRVED